MPSITRITTAAVLVAALAACGDDSPPDAAGDAAAQTISTAEWVAEFDRRCVEMAATLSDPAIDDEEFAEISARGIEQVRALPQPDDMADVAASMLDALETSSTDLSLTDGDIERLDLQFLEAAEALGVSDECLYGAAG